MDKCPYCKQPRELMVGDKPCKDPFHGAEAQPEMPVPGGYVYSQAEARALAQEVKSHELTIATLQEQNADLRRALAAMNLEALERGA